MLFRSILTDTTSALYGFGALVLDSFVQTEEHVGLGVHQTTSESYYGYLTPDELGWLLARVTANGSQSAQDWFNRVSDVKGRLESPAARRVWTEGQELALEEATNPPLGTRAFGRWWMYLLSRWWAELREVNQSFRAGLAYAFGGGRVTFQCFRCTQKLRLPVRKKVVATCGNCGDSMEYET